MIEQEEIQQFSMRKLAEKLEVKTASLYTHIESMEMLFLPCFMFLTAFANLFGLGGSSLIYRSLVSSSRCKRENMGLSQAVCVLDNWCWDYNLEFFRRDSCLSLSSVTIMIWRGGQIMIKVLFGEGESASMKAAKSKRCSGFAPGPEAVWMSGTKMPPRKTFSGWVEGTVQEVLCLGFLLDIGDIQEPVDSPYRKDLIVSMFSQDSWGQAEEWRQEFQETAESYVKNLLRLKEFLKQGEKIRIWYSDAPYSRCGFYHLCHILEAYDNEVWTVRLPEYVENEKRILFLENWGNISAEEFAGFLPDSRKLSAEEIHFYGKLWADLVRDNSPLRAMVNGNVIGVPEDFYDFHIWKVLCEQPVKEARVIGEILGRYRVNVSDWWYAKRIDYYIQQKKIRVVEDSKWRYARSIALNVSSHQQ